uniref:Uncharacterized protein n=1 Tax=Nothoprocta perdicaria TaxID=30464 RepID=A0A8C7A3V3_NOTPE
LHQSKKTKRVRHVGTFDHHALDERLVIREVLDVEKPWEGLSIKNCNSISKYCNTRATSPGMAPTHFHCAAR